MADWLRYRGLGYYVLFAFWVTGLIDLVLHLISTRLHYLLFFSGVNILYIPIGLLTVFSFVLWLRMTLARGYADYYILFTFWVTGLIDVVLHLVAPLQRSSLLFFGRNEVLYVPIGLLTVFSFLLWLIWSKIEKPKLINGASEPPGRVADAGEAF
jgi:hypothetical protein